MFEQTFKNIDDILYKDAGADSELDYIGQTSWVLFLRHLYESKIRNMGNAGRNGGQYYTPRPLIRAMIEVIQPAIGEKIYDGACGSCGFLCESYEYMTRERGQLNTNDLKTLQEKTFYGK